MGCEQQLGQPTTGASQPLEKGVPGIFYDCPVTLQQYLVSAQWGLALVGNKHDPVLLNTVFPP